MQKLGWKVAWEYYQNTLLTADVIMATIFAVLLWFVFGSPAWALIVIGYYMLFGFFKVGELKNSIRCNGQNCEAVLPSFHNYCHRCGKKVIQ